jgi:release factor glutamine methyltransferase
MNGGGVSGQGTPPAEGAPFEGLDPTPTLREVQRAAEARLRAAGVETPEIDARLLIQHALGLTREALLLQARSRLSPPMVGRVGAFVARRAAREPVSRILGRREFWSLDLRLDPSTLDPRPDTETVVQAALAELKAAPGGADRPLRILDLGTGTGCILLALLSELPRATGLGIDVQPAAVDAARANAGRLGLGDRAEFRAGDWAEGIGGRFDLVVSNPPYIPDGDVPGLEPEVRVHDPLAALAGGPDGLDAYRAIAPRLPGLLAPGGAFALELGQGQAEAVSRILRGYGLEELRVSPDLNGVERCLHGRAPL